MHRLTILMFAGVVALAFATPAHAATFSFQGLGDLPGSVFSSEAYGVSADGTVVVGTSDFESFRWTSGGGMVGLGHLPQGLSSDAYGVSADGSVVAGQAFSASGGEAFCWSSGGGLVSLRDLLVNHGVSNLTGWTLWEATGVSANGRTIVGYGRNPDGNTEAWVATVPEPSTLLLALCGAAAALICCGRSRVRTSSRAR